jgi:hypothetical protein
MSFKNSKIQRFKDSKIPLLYRARYVLYINPARVSAGTGYKTTPAENLESLNL